MFRCLFGHDEVRIVIDRTDYKLCGKCKKVWQLKFLTLDGQKGFWAWKIVTHRRIRKMVEEYLKDAERL